MKRDIIMHYNNYILYCCSCRQCSQQQSFTTTSFHVTTGMMIVMTRMVMMIILIHCHCAFTIFPFLFSNKKKKIFLGRKDIFCVCCAVCTEICFVIVACTKDYFLLPKKYVYCAVCMYLCSFFIHLWWLVRIKWDEKELCGRETFLGLFCVFFCYDFHKKRGRRCTYHFIKI